MLRRHFVGIVDQVLRQASATARYLTMCRVKWDEAQDSGVLGLVLGLLLDRRGDGLGRKSD